MDRLGNGEVVLGLGIAACAAMGRPQTGPRACKHTWLRLGIPVEKAARQRWTTRNSATRTRWGRDQAVCTDVKAIKALAMPVSGLATIRTVVVLRSCGPRRRARECAVSQSLTVYDKFRRRERCESAILSSCHPICNTALALFAPWCSCTRSIFADSSTLGGWPWRAQ
jgi:hypothetical protein